MLFAIYLKEMPPRYAIWKGIYFQHGAIEIMADFYPGYCHTINSNYNINSDYYFQGVFA